MGAGKSTIGRLLAARLGLVCVDLDQAIVEHAGKSIPQLFEEQGECTFRAIEREILHKLCHNGDEKVLATGGGVILAAPNRERIKQAGMVVWLDAPPETLAKRIAGDRNRPLLKGMDALAKAKSLDLERRKYYQMCADLRLDTSQVSAKKAVDEIVEFMKHFKKELEPSGEVKA